MAIRVTTYVLDPTMPSVAQGIRALILAKTKYSPEDIIVNAWNMGLYVQHDSGLLPDRSTHTYIMLWCASHSTGVGSIYCVDSDVYCCINGVSYLFTKMEAVCPG
jgi:hypothetical protein